MGNVIESFAQGIGNGVGKLFSSPVEFLSGKSCSSVCGPTWDFLCYIENFCVANLLRLAMVFILLYAVLLFFYLLHKLGIFGCIGRGLCKIIWACCSSYCCIWEYACAFLCAKLHKIKRRRRRRLRNTIDNRFYLATEQDYSDESISNRFPSLSRRRRDYKSSHLRKSLRVRNGDHARVEISSYRSKKHHGNNVMEHCDYKGNVHDIKVTRTSKFARKGVNRRKRILTK
ncbi:hypothetical protein HN51_018346 [Arachis hypogaea]|uniref:Uncharacterized protein LOC107481394 n=1 Tax=Arachis duranensis TaxID=130453 RepID=A0A6P4CTR4_ARADU|nr:uncharacterized protein LOC107481394 [Arachis duranensis]XP_025612939.1 uncharacterized protein LOC112706062 [Arachis hypogaea]QHO29900.1 uncharacterized protein DS421_8g228850 [Arachis hypogaea]